MTGALLTRVIETARALAGDLHDQPLLDRLAELQSRSSLELTADIDQLVSEMALINKALEMSSYLMGVESAEQRETLTWRSDPGFRKSDAGSFRYETPMPAVIGENFT
ncbi:hypothetical protein GCM10008955_33100 [Deinococcus malanensis]|uniref:Uncharacterized protein n=1 Tax=Deinococcus malanensis TaxID=1706855 RepID=A0ABQ2EZR5_9DEIO|nr:hypothetical protein [Deinococcus malanensis]GGK36674.1 hypothetical protein GCM10008955_33100 [Deinococcus malanensis]